MTLPPHLAGTPRKLTLAVLLSGLMLTLLAGCGGSSNSSPDAGTTAPGDDILMNQLQYLGTHNSYHIRAKQDLFELFGVYPRPGPNAGLHPHSTTGAV